MNLGVVLSRAHFPKIAEGGATAVSVKSFHFHGQTNCDWPFVLSGFAAEYPRMDKLGWPVAALPLA
jgi:hypothetical protein